MNLALASGTRHITLTMLDILFHKKARFNEPGTVNEDNRTYRFFKVKFK